MGNPNARRGPSSRAPASKPPQIYPLPAQPTQCTNSECRVTSGHEAKQYNADDRDLPRIVQVKHAGLDEALAAGNFNQARSNRDWLARFYTIHGAEDGSALSALPELPARPTRCRVPDCPVTAYHIDKEFAVGAEELPNKIKTAKKDFEKALNNGKYAYALDIRAFLERFWTVHGPTDGSALTSIPTLPAQCKDPLCPVTGAPHADKDFKQWARARDLPQIIKDYEARVQKVYDRYEKWQDMEENKVLNSFFAVHGTAVIMHFEDAGPADVEMIYEGS